MQRKYLILTALVLAVFTLMFTFTACVDKKPADTGTEPVVTVEPATETEGRLFAEVPDDLNFKGGEIVFLVIGEGYNGAEWTSQDIYAEAETEDPIVTAVYRRNMILQEAYGCTIVEEQNNAPSSQAAKSIKSGSDDYQVLMCDTKGTLTLMQNNQLLNLNETGGIDLKQPWWDQNLRKNCSVGGKNFFATGDISIMDNDATWVLMFNKELVKTHDLESPYKLVEENKWTYDKMYEMMLAVAKDDGDSKVEKLEDTFGWCTHDSSREALYYAAGLSVVQKDENDLPVLVQNNTEYIIKVLEKAQKLWGHDDDTVFCNASSSPTLTMPELQQVFQEGRSLFLGEVLQLVIRLREMDIDFGLIPYPKFSPEQENYGNTVHSTSAMLSIPITCQDYENVSYFVEAMACESMYTLTPAYYDVTLKNKMLRDTESEAMLTIILNSRTFDLGSVHMCDFGSMASIFTSLVTSGNTTYQSDFNKKLKVANKAIVKFVQKVG